MTDAPMPNSLLREPLGRTGLKVPPIIFGTSCLGNLYEALPWDEKLAIMRAWFEHVPKPIVIDTAGKYGAGLALEAIGQGLRELGIAHKDIVISNKLGWRRVPLDAEEPTFEPGVWADLEHDAEQDISAEGMRRCWEQGGKLLGAPYAPQLASVHDPDEYLAAAASEHDRGQRFDDLVAAYSYLNELKQRGEIAAVGVGAKDWRVIAALHERIELDWVMLANSLTIYRHPPELLEFVHRLRDRGIGIINSAVFHAGFLVGGRFFDYVPFDASRSDHAAVQQWRERFHARCRDHGVRPAHACIRYALDFDAVSSIALNTSNASRIAENVDMVATPIDLAFWEDLASQGLIDSPSA